MKLKEILVEEIRTVINVTSSSIDAIARRAFRNIPEHLWEHTTPRTELTSFNINTTREPTKEELQKIIDDINSNVSKAFLKAAEDAAKKFMGTK